jgi:hypothetical protein
MKDFFFKYSYILFYFLLLILFVQGIKKANQKSDFQDYYSASKLFVEKKDLYNQSTLTNLKSDVKLDDLFKPENLLLLEKLKGNIGTYIYPPLFAFLLIPFSFLNYEIASVLFVSLNFICLLISLFLCSRFFSSKRIYTILFITILISFKFLENHVVNNQVAFILLALVLFSVYTKNSILSGLSLSLAIWIKITPAIFLLYFLLQKDFRKIGYTFVFGIFWMLLPSLFSHEYNFASLLSWKELILDNAMKNPEFRSWKNNQSLIATLAKYFLPNADILNQSQMGLPFFDLTKQTLQYLFYTVSVLIVYPFLKQSLNIKDRFQTLSILFLLSILFSGISWIHSFVFLLFPIFYLTYLIFETDQIPKIKYSYIAISISLVLLNKTFLGSNIESFLLMFSYLLYLSLAYYIILLSINTDYVRSKVQT